MKYVQKDMGDAAEINAGDGKPFKELAKLLSMAMVAILVIYLTISFATEKLVDSLSVEKEREWLSRIDFITPSLSTSTESIRLAKVKDLLLSLTQHEQVPSLKYQLIEIESDEINAFAFPGGTIGITSGLLNAVTDDNAIAFVLGHELGHFKYRHHLKGFSRALSFGILFGLVSGDQTQLEVTQQFLTILDNRHSQQQEIDADNFGAKLVIDVLGTSENIEQLFEILSEKDSERLQLTLLSTHPSSQQRIENLQNIANQYFNPQSVNRVR